MKSGTTHFRSQAEQIGGLLRRELGEGRAADPDRIAELVPKALEDDGEELVELRHGAGPALVRAEVGLVPDLPVDDVVAPVEAVRPAPRVMADDAGADLGVLGEVGRHDGVVAVALLGMFDRSAEPEEDLLMEVRAREVQHRVGRAEAVAGGIGRIGGEDRKDKCVSQTGKPAACRDQSWVRV